MCITYVAGFGVSYRMDVAKGGFIKWSRCWSLDTEVVCNRIVSGSGLVYKEYAHKRILDPFQVFRKHRHQRILNKILKPIATAFTLDMLT